MQQDNFLYLLLALLLFIVGMPFMQDAGLMSPRISMVVGTSCLLAIGVWSLRGSGRVFLVGMLAVVAGIVQIVLSALHGTEWAHIGAAVAMFIFLLLAAYSAMRQVVVGNEINPNRVVGAVCIYLLLGVMWALVYGILEFLRPGSFRGLTDTGLPVENLEWIYYSFVTIATLGYGDITPLTRSARALSVLEAIVGQFYIAVLVAGLVSAYISAKQGAGGRD